LRLLARRVRDRVKWIDIIGVLDEFSDSLHRELDYRVEAHHIDRFRHNFLYAANQAGSVYAVRPDGTQTWHFHTRATIVPSPVLASDESLLLATKDGRLYALDPTGRLKWMFRAAESVTSPPAIAEDGTIYFATESWGEARDRLYALDRRGRLKRRVNTNGALAAHSGEFGHSVRRIPAAQSGPNRPLIPVHSGHPHSPSERSDAKAVRI